MRTSTADSNKAHYAALEVVAKAVKRGVKIKYSGVTISAKPKKMKANKASFKKVVN